MLDPDISTPTPRRLLSQPDRLGDVVGPDGWTRRKFLQAVGGGVLGGAAIGIARPTASVSVSSASTCRRRSPATPIGAHDGIVVIIVLYGGNDGLNTVVPYTNGSYYDVRGPSNGNLAIPASQVLPLDGTFGLHPSLSYTKRLWDAGQVAIVHGVGYPNPDLSHFTSMAIWMNGQVRRRCGRHRLDRPLARRPTGGDRRPHGRDHRLVGAAAPARRCPPRRRRARRTARACSAPGPMPSDAAHVQRPARRCRRARPDGVRGTTCSPASLKTQLDLAHRGRAGVRAAAERRRLRRGR